MTPSAVNTALTTLRVVQVSIPENCVVLPVMDNCREVADGVCGASTAKQAGLVLPVLECSSW